MNRYYTSIVSLVMIAFVSLCASADIPTGYYTSLNGKKDVALKTAVRDIIYNHTEVSSYSDLPQYFRKTDARPGTNQWWEMYSDEVFYLPSFSGLNREHSVPKSWWGGSTSIPAYTDLNHLYPSEMNANSAKNNYPLGTVLTATFDNGVSKVGYAVTGQGGGAAKVFEPADEYKGDFARTYFYMATCYAGYVTWKYSYMFQETDLTLNDWSQTLLLKWHREDPVSEKEINRNEVVFGFQNNRNPFIDFPDLAEYIWGNKKGQTFSTSQAGTPTGEANLITPTQGMEVDFGEVAIGNTVNRQLFFNGENLTGSLTLTLSSSGNPDMFEVASTSIKASLVNAESGYWLNITYNPTAIGDHTGRLIISDGGITGSRGVALSGGCREVPTLSSLIATEPTDITDTSYTANWEASADDIDYYVVTRTRYADGGGASTEEIEAESNSLEITDFDQSMRETYSVQAVRLGYRSAMSNVITVDHAGISGVEMDAPLGVAYCPGGVRFVCGEEHTGGRIYDASGRLVRTIDVITNNMEVMLPWGVYFIVTDQLSKPISIIVK